LDSVREDSRFAGEKYECDGADEWWEDEWESGERREKSQAGKCEPFKQESEWYADKGAEQNGCDR
jgi:hypothetical protein